tara:strand:- start:65 stop:589 length:525 start_codon:yes stop_codon:yes gene_type:complete
MMPLVSLQKRSKLLEELKTGLRSLSLGELTNEYLEYRCRISPLLCYESSEEGGFLPASWDKSEAPEIVPLWECDLTMIAMRGEEYLEIDWENIEDITLIARSEQGLLSYVFFYLIEDLGGANQLMNQKQDYESLLQLSREMGFEHLKAVIEFQRNHGADFNCVDLLLEFTLSIP